MGKNMGGREKRYLKRPSRAWAMLLLVLFIFDSTLLVAKEKDEGDEEEDKIEVKKTTSKTKEKYLTLSMGVSRIIEFTFDTQELDIGDATLFDVNRIPENGVVRKLRLTPKTSGYTNMTVYDTQKQPRVTYFVRVTREDVGQVISQLEELIGDIEGVKIKPVGGTIVIDGDILLPKDMLRIIRVVDAMKDRDPKKKEVPIRNIANISKITMNIIAERIEREINSPEINARVLNNNILLEGTAENDFEADRAVEIAKTYLPEALVEKNAGDGVTIKPKQAGGAGGGVPTIIDFLRVRPRQAPPPAQDIKITMNYVELNNEYEKNFNFQWRPLANDTSTVGFNSSLGEFSANLVATVSSLLPKLVSARNHGHARVLKQQTIITKDQAPAAAIDSSLQIFVSQVDERGVRSVQPVTIQNATKIQARVVPGSDSVDLAIQIQLSSPVGQQNGTPVIASNSIQTQVTVKNGDSAAIGGNAVDQTLAGYNREPTSGGTAQGGGGNNQSQGNPLFNLQRSKTFSRNKNQYVIFITPEILRTAGAGTEDITRKFRLNAGER